MEKKEEKPLRVAFYMRLSREDQNNLSDEQLKALFGNINAEQQKNEIKKF